MVLASPSLSSVLTRSTSVSSSSASPDVNTPATPASNFPPSPPSLSPYNKKSSPFSLFTSPSSSYEDDATRPEGGRMVTAGRERGDVERAGSRSGDHRQQEGLGLTFHSDRSPGGRPSGEGESVHGTEEEARRLTFQERLTAMQTWSKSRTSVVYLKGGSAILQILVLSTLLALAHHTPSPHPPISSPASSPPSPSAATTIYQAEACPRRYPLEVWMIVHICRVSVCWPTSCWLFFRRRRAERMMEEERHEEREEGGEGGGGGEDSKTRGPSPLAYSLDLLAPKLSLLCLLLNLTFFIFGTILLSLSVDCRSSTPLLWWGVFSGLAVGYLLMLEVFVLIVGCWVWITIQNRLYPPARPSPPASPPPEPLSPLLLDKLPLKRYIPVQHKPECLAPSSSPTSSPSPPLAKPYRFLSRRTQPTPPATSAPANETVIYLDDHHASCTICLCDYEPDRRDVLRILPACQHVFHPECVDAWLTGISARCPVCSKPVEV